jgi:hypothetical protein
MGNIMYEGETEETYKNIIRNLQIEIRKQDIKINSQREIIEKLRNVVDNIDYYNLPNFVPGGEKTEN